MNLIWNFKFYSAQRTPSPDPPGTTRTAHNHLRFSAINPSDSGSLTLDHCAQCLSGWAGGTISWNLTRSKMRCPNLMKFTEIHHIGSHPISQDPWWCHPGGIGRGNQRHPMVPLLVCDDALRHCDAHFEKPLIQESLCFLINYPSQKILGRKACHAILITLYQSWFSGMYQWLLWSCNMQVEARCKMWIWGVLWELPGETFLSWGPLHPASLLES